MIFPAKIVTWQTAIQIKPRVCLQTKGGCFSPYLGVIFCSQTAGDIIDSSILDFKKKHCRYCIAELTSEFNKASDSILTFPRIPVQSAAILTLDKKAWFTRAPVLSCSPCTETTKWSRNGAWLTLRRLPIFTECNLWHKTFRVGGKRGGSVGFPETRLFFFFFFFLP